MTAPEEPETALARGAALASANASLGAPATVAIPQAQLAGPGVGELAYSAVADDDDLYAEHGRRPWRTSEPQGIRGGDERDGAVFVVGVVALALALALGIRPHVEQRSSLSKNVVAPASHAPAPKAQVPAPPPPSAVPAPVTQAPSKAPAPVVQQPAADVAPPPSRNHRCIPGNGTAGTTAAGSGASGPEPRHPAQNAGKIGQIRGTTGGVPAVDVDRLWTKPAGNK